MSDKVHEWCKNPQNLDGENEKIFEITYFSTKIKTSWSLLGIYWTPVFIAKKELQTSVLIVLYFTAEMFDMKKNTNITDGGPKVIIYINILIRKYEEQAKF